jgi:prephenate dehydrogenase
MKKQPKQTISIFGTGLIGGSFAKSLHQKYNIIGIDIAKQTSDIFLTQLEIENTAEIKKAIQSSNFIFICAHLSAYQNIANILSSTNIGNAEIFEFGSVKLFPKTVLKNLPNLTLCHPIAGSEKSGFQSSNTNLFNNKLLLINKSNKNIERIANECNFKKIAIIDEDEHDEIYAKTSHVPQMTMFLLKDFVKKYYSSEQDLPSLNNGLRLMNANEKIWFGEFGIFNLNIKNIQNSIIELTNYIDNQDQKKILDTLQEYFKYSTCSIQDHRGSGINDIINADFSNLKFSNLEVEKFRHFLQSINLEKYAKTRNY